MYIMTGAPKTGVTALIGITVFCGITQIRLHNIHITAPVSIVVGNSMVWSDVFVSIRAMCGTASPTNAIGPQKAVLAAVSMPVAVSSSRRVRLMSTPKFAA